MVAPPSKSLVPPTRRPRLLWAIVAGYAALYVVLCWRRYQSFHAQIDLSYYLRLAWGLGHGHLDLPLVQAPHLLGLHLEPVMLPLALLGRLGVPLVPLLLLGQAVAVALLAWPAWDLGQRHLGERAAPWAAAAALLYPTVTVATLHDFHPVTLALAPLLAFVAALDQGRLRRALLFGALALACREDIALQLALGLLAYALPGGLGGAGGPSGAGGPGRPGGSGRPDGPGRPGGLMGTRPGLGSGVRLAMVGLAALLVAYFLTYIALIQPLYLPKFGSYGLHFASLGGDKGQPGRAVGSGRDMLLALASHPLAVLRLFISWERLGYVLRLLWPVGLVALLAPRALAGALPILAINFLSSFPRVRTIESHYTTAMVPFIVGAALIGAGRLRLFLARQRAFWQGLAGARTDLGRALALGLCGLAAAAHLFHGGSPLAVRSARFSWDHFRDPPDAAALRAAIAWVSPGASVAARPGPLAHLCQRPRVISPPEYDDGQPVDVVLTPDAAPARNRIGGVPITSD